MSPYAETWETVERLLREAASRLSSDCHARGVATETFDEFEEFLSHNELELAWDCLAEVGARQDASADFWSMLADAARRMELSEKAEQASGWALRPTAVHS